MAQCIKDLSLSPQNPHEANVVVCLQFQHSWGEVGSRHGGIPGSWVAS